MFARVAQASMSAALRRAGVVIVAKIYMAASAGLALAEFAALVRRCKNNVSFFHLLLPRMLNVERRLALDWYQCFTKIRTRVGIGENFFQLAAADLIDRCETELAIESLAGVILEDAEFGAMKCRM